MDVLGQAEHLEYENYFYISLPDTPDELVLEVTGGNGIVFSRREPGKRSQLWSQNVEGRIIHEGITSKDSPSKYCLDIAQLAVVVEGCSCLALRKVDSRRQSTQIWKFRAEGRLTCGIQAQCLQCLPAFGGMSPGARVALGPYDPDLGVTAESHVEAVKMLPGSGVLSLTIHANGPTRTLRIADLHDLENISSVRLHSPTGQSVPGIQSEPSKRIVSILVHLSTGVGVSLINHIPEELLYMTLNKLKLKVDQSSATQRLSLSVRHIQVDNQLYGSGSPVLLYSIPSKQKQPSKMKRGQAFELEWQRNLSVKSSMHVFKLLSVQISRLSVDIDEMVLLKVFEMLTANQVEHSDMEVVRLQFPKHKQPDHPAKKYYFGLLQVACGQVTLSVHTAARLPHSLQETRRKLAVAKLYTFENAKIDFDPFIQVHPFESLPFLIKAVGKSIIFIKPVAWWCLELAYSNAFCYEFSRG